MTDGRRISLKKLKTSKYGKDTGHAWNRILINDEVITIDITNGYEYNEILPCIPFNKLIKYVGEDESDRLMESYPHPKRNTGH